MNILFVGVKFYNYDSKITEELRNMGHTVMYITDSSYKYVFPARFTPQKILDAEWRNYQSNELMKIKGVHFDVVFVTVGRYLQKETLEELKRNNPNARFILYLWDDVARVENFNSVKSYYDIIFSFDPIDCVRHAFRFLPLFYTDEFYPADVNKHEYDLYSAVSSHSDRVNIIKKICDDNPEGKFLFYVLLSRPEYMYRNAFDRKKDDRIKYIRRPVSKEYNREHLMYSKALLDIPYLGQNGLTIRTFESIRCGIKLITTNESIKYYDFYDKDSICIIDRKNPCITEDFLQGKFSIDSSIIEKYSLHNWLDTILAEKQGDFLKHGIKLADIVENQIEAEREE